MPQIPGIGSALPAGNSTMPSFQLSHVRLNVRDEGQGTPVLLVHGFPLSHRMWEGQFALADRCRMIAPDLRGFGASEVTPGTVTMEQFADDLHALLNALDLPRCVLCGLSMGGYIAMAFARKYPTRLAGLALCDTRAIADTPEGAAGRKKLAEKVLAEGPAPVVEAMMPKLFAARTATEQPGLLEETRAVMAATQPAGIAAALLGMAARADSTTLLPTLSVPTLVLVGAEDVISPAAEMRGIAAAIPNSRFVEVAGVGHMAPLEAPGACNAALADLIARCG
jgi:3-oxoadipate enol-lactonase